MPSRPRPGWAKYSGECDPLVAAGLQQHDVERLQRVLDSLQRLAQEIHRDFVAGGHAAHVDDHAGGEAPFERHLVDAPRRLALGERPVMIRRIHVRAGVGDGLDLLDGPAFAFRPDQVFGAHAEELLHLRQSFALRA